MKKFEFLSHTLILLCALANTCCEAKSYKIVCYLGSWANYRSGDGKFVVEDIDPSLCTHLIYGFAKLSGDKIAVYDAYLDLKEGLGGYQRFNRLKEQNPDLKTLIAIGGWNEESSKYSHMASNPDRRRNFVNSCVNFLSTHGFDGLDLDWEFPANRGGRPEDKLHFFHLIRDLREAFKPRGFLLSAAVGAGKQTTDSAYDVPGLAKYLDFINLMAYDFHGSWEPFTGHNAPLHSKPGESEENRNLNVEFSVDYWLSKGCPAQKLILGMPTYGRGFTLENPDNNGLYVPTTGPSAAGEYTKEPGILGYNEICKKLKTEEGWNVVFDSSIKAPYAYRDNQWVGYDNNRSIEAKVDFLQRKKLGGGMIWALETDDFRGDCHGHKYHILRAINERLGGSSSIDRRPAPLAGGERHQPCPFDGYFRNPHDCKQFYVCQSGRPTIFNCPAGTVYSNEFKVCAFPFQVPDC